MPVDWKNRVVFIHIPKCGGTSLENRYDLNHPENLYQEDFKAFCINGIHFAPQHFTWDIIVARHPEVADFPSYAVVRDPLEKLVSEYFYLKERFYLRPVVKFSEFKFFLWVLMTRKNMDHLLDQNQFLGPNTQVISLHELDEKITDLDALHKFESTVGLKRRNSGRQNSQRIADRLTKLTRMVCQLKYRTDYKKLQEYF